MSDDNAPLIDMYQKMLGLPAKDRPLIETLFSEMDNDNGRKGLTVGDIINNPSIQQQIEQDYDETPADLVILKEATATGLARVIQQEGQNVLPAALATFFLNDGYLSAELRTALLTPQDGAAEDPRKFEYAALMAVQAARPLLGIGPNADDEYSSPGALTLHKARAWTTTGVYVLDPLHKYWNTPYPRLNVLIDMHALRRDLFPLARALGFAEHPSFAQLLMACGVRAHCISEHILSDARARLQVGQTLLDQVFKPKPPQ